MRRAFTLIELLVVVAIVAVLAGMLMPAIAQVRDAARQLSCGNNQRQCLLAITAYASDWDGLTPAAEGATPLPAYDTRNWFSALFAGDWLPDGPLAGWDTSTASRMAMLRWPSPVACTAFRPPTPSAGNAYFNAAFGVRYDFDPAHLGFRSDAHGSSRLTLLRSEVPFLADTVVTTQLQRSAFYWRPDAPQNDAALHLVHRKRRAVVGYGDGRVGALDQAGLAAERVLVAYAPP
ncbi:MAG: prepilin-type N-terminal cleavage/methylation domain-containing protein [Planctomycetes bacterium]|nr:prepilin-type N-terminal cleavage/methylation domain-containing protein [Planctomycetota bacterium]